MAQRPIQAVLYCRSVVNSESWRASLAMMLTWTRLRLNTDCCVGCSVSVDPMACAEFSVQTSMFERVALLSVRELILSLLLKHSRSLQLLANLNLVCRSFKRVSFGRPCLRRLHASSPFAAHSALLVDVRDEAIRNLRGQ